MLIPESVSGKEVQYYREEHNVLSGNTVVERLQSQPEHKFQVYFLLLQAAQNIILFSAVTPSTDVF